MTLKYLKMMTISPSTKHLLLSAAHPPKRILSTMMTIVTTAMMSSRILEVLVSSMRLLNIFQDYVMELLLVYSW